MVITFITTNRAVPTTMTDQPGDESDDNPIATQTRVPPENTAETTEEAAIPTRTRLPPTKLSEDGKEVPTTTRTRDS